MGTRSVTHIHHSDLKSAVLVSIYQQYDGYFDGVGEDLKEFLTGFKIVNGFGMGDNTKTANGMGCSAAQIISHLKTGIGGTYITTSDNEQEFDYHIFTDPSGTKVCLIGSGYDGTKIFNLYNGIDTYNNDDDVTNIVGFEYPDKYGNNIYRTLEVKEEDEHHISGLDLIVGDKPFKKFLKNKIVDGIIDRNLES